METVLNLIWCLLVAAGLAVWLRHARRESANRCTQFIALCSLAFILFPVVSVTDDLWAARNPAEVETSVRQDKSSAHLRVAAPEMPSVPTEEFAGVPALVTTDVQIAERAPRFFTKPSRSPLFSRPPPAA